MHSSSLNESTVWPKPPERRMEYGRQKVIDVASVPPAKKAGEAERTACFQQGPLGAFWEPYVNSMLSSSSGEGCTLVPTHRNVA